MPFKEQMENILRLWQENRVGKIFISLRLLTEGPTACDKIFQAIRPIEISYNEVSDAFVVTGVSSFFAARLTDEEIPQYLFHFDASGKISHAEKT